MRHKVVPPICRLEDLRPEKSSAFFRFSRHSPWSPASADFGSLHTKKRICLQQTYPLRSHSKKTSVLYPYVGIIQIRLRVWETHPTLSRLTASSPFPVLYYYSAVLFDFQVIFSWYQLKSQALNAKNITGFCVLSFSQFPFCFFVHIQQPSNFAISSLKRSSAVP